MTNFKNTIALDLVKNLVQNHIDSMPWKSAVGGYHAHDCYLSLNSSVDELSEILNEKEADDLAGTDFQEILDLTSTEAISRIDLEVIQDKIIKEVEAQFEDYGAEDFLENFSADIEIRIYVKINGGRVSLTLGEMTVTNFDLEMKI